MDITPEIQALLDAQKTELTNKFTEDNAGLVKHQQILMDEKKALHDDMEAAKLDKAVKNKDVATLSESYETKLKTEREALQAIKSENSKLLGNIKQTELGKISSAFISENVVDDPFIRDAFSTEYSKRLDIREGKTVILDPDGNLTALTLDDLNQEFKSASKYAAHIRVSKSTGGGANGSRSTGGAGAIANLGGSTAEKSAALVNKIPALASLPVR